ncbi:hypothetical protein DM860_017849 [Cuscuta australis]|uniref:Alpha-ketoglutarate-dependent dioxygenase AlkB-like domain-containing protein n=1 Tax=Cuscuta australis TaxID=267555 RepID=A0A328DU67_9ASTE|nr:hypothetical protein DM860_017849 [Cuscuta australis]
MATQSGNAVSSLPEKAGGAGGMVMHHQHHMGQQQWYHPPHHHQMDERDAFMSWLRGEFAASNAIIDAMCHHLRMLGEPGEYEGVIGCIQQRRCNWNSVLYMQQYFSVAEVVYELQQVEYRKHRRGFDGGGFKGRRTGGGGRFFTRNEGFRDGRESDSHNYTSDNKDSNVTGSEKLDSADKEAGTKQADKKGTEYPERPESNSLTKSLESSQSGDLQSEANKENRCDANSDGSCGMENECNSTQVPNGKQNLTITPKTFVGKELCDGKMVNVVDGLKLYEKLLSDSEVSKLVTLVSELRAAGKSGQLQGQTFIVSKRPMKGHGREIIQLGAAHGADVTESEAPAGISKDRKIEPIPVLLQDIIDSLTSKHVFSVKPDSCMIDIFNEGDHSQPNVWPHMVGRPVCVLFLTECEITYGKVIETDHRGDYQGCLRLTLAPGSLLVMQGLSADLAKHALPSIRKLRILVTLTKSQLEKTVSGNGPRGPTFAGPPAAHRVSCPPPSKSPNHSFRPSAPRHYNSPAPASNVIPPPPAPIACPPLPPNGIQPIFVSTPLPSPPMPFPAPPAPVGWVATPHPRNPPPPRVLVPGTGVFFPPGSGNPPNHSLVPTPSPTNGPSKEDVAPPPGNNNGGLGMSSGGDISTPVSEVGDGEGQKKVEVLNGNAESSEGVTNERLLS